MKAGTPSSLVNTVLAAVLLNSVLSCWLYAQPEAEITEETVSESTRMDWTFVLATRSFDTVPDEWLANYPDEATYRLYVPESFNPDKANGLILFVSPTPRAMAVESRWRAVCDEMGLILAAPHGVGNQCDPPVRIKVILDVLDDVRRKYSIETDRTYISGFSGGGRVATSIAFALPEYFGGVMPIGAAAELRVQEAWLRQRVAERLSVALVLGSEDFNHCEVTTFRGPLLELSGVRTSIRVVDGIDHTIPESPELIEAVRWLDEDLENRRLLADEYPSTRISGDRDPPSAAAQANAFYNEAQMMLSESGREFDAYMLLKGLVMRWPDSRHTGHARRLLGRNSQWQQTEIETLLKYLIDRSRGYERFTLEETHEMYLPQRENRLQTAIENWEQIVENAGDNADALAEAQERIKALKELLQETKDKAAESEDPDSDDKGE